jgi:hypothetical protein
MRIGRKGNRARKRPTLRQLAATWRRLGLRTRDQRLREIQGKYAWIPGSSEDFIAEKHREIEGET